MRTRTLSNALTYVAAGSIVAASPAVHKHHHHIEYVEARAPENVQTVNVPGPTLIAYELNGQSMDQDTVCQGIRDGSLRWADDTHKAPECFAHDKPNTHSPAVVSTAVLVSSPAPTGQEPPNSVSTPHSLPNAVKASKPNTVQPTSLSKSPTTSKTSQSVHESSSSAASGESGGDGLDDEFPDGIVPCSQFPSDFGPIKVDWAELGGWTGIQYVKITNSRVTHIDTAIPGGEGCRPGAMCSYACPPGYQKSQWPSAQGVTGQSVGGLRCNANGKLSLTNPNLSRKLCIRGTGATVVHNKLSTNAAICRTDYPGTEHLVSN